MLPRFLVRLTLPALVLGGIAPLPAQSALQNTPNIATGWVAPRHELLFDLVHRFSVGPAPARKVLNASTLGLYAGVTSTLQVGVTYASASEFLPESPNEFEFSARLRGLRQGFGSPVDVYVQGAWNKTLASVDGQLFVGRRFGAARAMATVTWLGDAFTSGEGRGAIGAGLVVPLASHVALAADATSLLDRADGEKVTWSAGLQMGVAETPHTLSIHVSNVAGRTLQGSVAASPTRRVGFEYTIPITFGARRQAIDASARTAPSPL